MKNQTLNKVNHIRDLKVGDFVTANGTHDGKIPVGIGKVEKKTPEIVVVYFPFWKAGHNSNGHVDKPITDNSYWTYSSDKINKLNKLLNAGKVSKASYLIRICTEETETEQVKATFKLSLRLRNKLSKMVVDDESVTAIEFGSGISTDYSTRYKVKRPHGSNLNRRAQLIFNQSLIKGDTAVYVFPNFETFDEYLTDIKLVAKKMYEAEILKKQYTIQLVGA